MRILTTLLTSVFLAACGTKGPLVLPPKPAAGIATPAQSNSGTAQPDDSKAKPGSSL